MASIKKTPSGSYQLRVMNILLPKTFWATFDTEEQTSAYGAQLEGLLAQGIVPTSLFDEARTGKDVWTISRCVAEYLRSNSVPSRR